MLRLLCPLLLVVASAIRPTLSAPEHVPTIWLAGDSTMAPGGGHNGTEGWGQYLQYSFGGRAYVNNSAYAGRSMRSFTREGRFDAIAAKIVPGDWVVIEMGINDGGGVSLGDKGRGDCPGQGNETCPTVYANVSEIVQTFTTYQHNATRLMLSKGAQVILSAREPTNVWQSGNYSYTPDQYTYYAWLDAYRLGGPEAGVYFVDHGSYSAQVQKNLGHQFVDSQYPMDNTHTAPMLADYVAKAFVLGLKCGSSPLSGLVVNATARLESGVLGPCVTPNATLPV